MTPLCVFVCVCICDNVEANIVHSKYFTNWWDSEKVQGHLNLDVSMVEKC